MTSSKFGAIPEDVREYLKMLMHINYELRPDAGQVMKVGVCSLTLSKFKKLI